MEERGSLIGSCGGESTKGEKGHAGESGRPGAEGGTTKVKTTREGRGSKETRVGKGSSSKQRKGEDLFAASGKKVLGKEEVHGSPQFG